MDEKPHIEALERAQRWLRLPNGKALTATAGNLMPIQQRHRQLVGAGYTGS